jgi:hypothetical protein
LFALVPRLSALEADLRLTLAARDSLRVFLSRLYDIVAARLDAPA